MKNPPTKDQHYKEISSVLVRHRQKSWLQISIILATSTLPFLLLMALSLHLMKYSYLWVLALALPIHIFHARMFLVFHDCGHLSFFRQKWLNHLVGHIHGLFYYTPYFLWQQVHNRHHAYQGRLDQRKLNVDAWTLTVQEYQQAPKWKQIAYRLYRSPWLFCTIIAWFSFLVAFRVNFAHFGFKERVNIHAMNIALVTIGIFVAHTIGLQNFILWQAPVLLLSYSMAGWNFYLQHQFEDAVWERDANHDGMRAALLGSSHLNVPGWFHWWLGNITHHNLHHADVQVPFYNLPSARNEIGPIPGTVELGFADVSKAFQMKLWDEEKRKMVSF